MFKTFLRRGLPTLVFCSAVVTQAAACNVSVPFATGSSALSTPAQSVLSRIAQANQGRQFQLVGYASPEGSSAANLALSQRRAQAVSNYLTQASGGTVRSTVRFAGESATQGRSVLITGEPCNLTGVAAARGPVSGAALGQISPTVAAGVAVGVLALGAAIAASGGDAGSGSTTTSTTD